MSPQERGWDAGAGRHRWALPGPRVCSCQVRLGPSERGHSSRTQEFPTAAGSGDAPGDHKHVQSCCSGHGAAISLPQLLAAHETTARHDGGDPGVPHVPLAHQDLTLPRTGSSCPGSRHRLSTTASPHAQPRAMVSLSSSMAATGPPDTLQSPAWPNTLRSPAQPRNGS